jgi:phosphoribosylanthranilate isomerase
MFDAKPPKDADLPGGTGARFDWTPAGRPAIFERPHFLAGGLDPWNVAEADRPPARPWWTFPLAWSAVRA